MCGYIEVRRDFAQLFKRVWSFHEPTSWQWLHNAVTLRSLHRLIFVERLLTNCIESQTLSTPTFRSRRVALHTLVMKVSRAHVYVSQGVSGVAMRF